jgi:hypothetical protein
MKSVFTVAMLSLLAWGAYATDTKASHPTSHTMTASQQTAEKECHKEASAKKLQGDARNKFMKQCMEAKQ